MNRIKSAGIIPAFGPVYITQEARNALRIPVQHCTPNMLQNWTPDSSSENRLIPIFHLLENSSAGNNVDYSGGLAFDGRPIRTEQNTAALEVVDSLRQAVDRWTAFQGAYRTAFTGLGKERGTVKTAIDFTPDAPPVVSTFIFVDGDSRSFYLVSATKNSTGDTPALRGSCPGGIYFKNGW